LTWAQNILEFEKRCQIHDNPIGFTIAKNWVKLARKEGPKEKEALKVSKLGLKVLLSRIFRSTMVLVFYLGANLAFVGLH
jgi:hypothetical protein